LPSVSTDTPSLVTPSDTGSGSSDAAAAAAAGSLSPPGSLGNTRARLVLPGLVGAGLAGVLVGPFLSWRAAKAEDAEDAAGPGAPGDGRGPVTDGDEPQRRRIRLPRRKGERS
jgi:hypothetical protein